MATNPMSATRSVAEAPPVPQQVQRARLLVNDGIEEYWVHCAVCGATPDGHYDSGQIKWNGGVVYGSPRGNKNIYAYACRCAAGESLHENQQMPHFDQAPDLVHATWETVVLPVVKARDETPRLPGLAQMEKFHDACFTQVRRFFAGDLDYRALAENVSTLMSRLAPDLKPLLSPDDLLLSEDLWQRYFSGIPYPHRGIASNVARTREHD